jgi:hypothetical protein
MTGDGVMVDCEGINFSGRNSVIRQRAIGIAQSQNLGHGIVCREIGLFLGLAWNFWEWSQGKLNSGNLS